MFQSGMASILQSEAASSAIRGHAETQQRFRKRTTDVREFLPIVSLFKILEPLKAKLLPITRSFIKDVTKYSFQPGDSIAINTREHGIESTWLVFEGTIRLSKLEGTQIKSESVVLERGKCFGSPLSVLKEQLDQPQDYEEFEATAEEACLLFCIENASICKIHEMNEIQEQQKKRNLICNALNLHTSGNTIKAFTQKFVIRRYNKAHVLVHQEQKEDTFFVVSRGDAEIIKQCSNENREKMRVSIGIVSEGNFINDSSFFKQLEVGPCEYTIQAMTEIEVYTLPKGELFKYFYDLPTLWPNIAMICIQKHEVRQQSVLKHLQRKELLEVDECNIDKFYPLYKKSSQGFRKQVHQGNEDFVKDAIKYEQIVANKESIVRPLNTKKFSEKDKKSHHLDIGEIQRLIKKEKMDVIKVKNLVYNRIRGIKSEEINIELKPTLFNDRVKLNLLDHPQKHTTELPSTSSTTRNQRKSLSVRNIFFDNLKNQPDDPPSNPTGKFPRPKRFRMVAPAREHFQTYINRSTDPYILTRCQTGKTRKIRAVG